MSRKFRWGIMGTGAIARLFAKGIAASREGSLHAVASRSAAPAEAFAAEFGAARAHATYESLAADPEVDAVYVASPHSEHRANAILALESGKPVLLEKPFAINRAQAEEVVAVARAKGLFLMEAMWTRYFPIMAELRRLVGEGAIGEVRMIDADFGFRADFNPEGRLFDPRFGGGSLLDVGIYPLSITSMLLGKPERIASMADLGSTGVDEQAAFILGYPAGVLAVLKSAVRVDSQQELTVVGATGYLRVHSPFWKPSAMSLARDGVVESRIELPYEGNGYNYEADEVARCVRAGQLESPIMPLAETLDLMETMDRIRTQWGLVYPME